MIDGLWLRIETATDRADRAVGERYGSLSVPKHWALEVCSAVLLILVAALLIAAARSAVRGHRG